MDGSFLTQSPSIINVAKNAGAAFIVGAAGSTGVVVGLGLGGMILAEVAKKKLTRFIREIKTGFNS